MTTERNIINDMLATSLTLFSDFIDPLKWLMVASIIIVLVDLRFGIRAARARKEAVRWSRAGRRTINKAVDYFCWILIAGVMDKAFGVPFDVPILPAVVMIVVLGLEINSCFQNYFEARGLNYRIDIFKILSRNKVIEVEPIEQAEKTNENRN